MDIDFVLRLLYETIVVLEMLVNLSCKSRRKLIKGLPQSLIVAPRYSELVALFLLLGGKGALVWL